VRVTVRAPRRWRGLQGCPVRGGEAGAAPGRTQPVPPAPTDPAQGTAEPRSRGGETSEKAEGREGQKHDAGKMRRKKISGETALQTRR